METNQKDKSNQQTESKSHLEHTQDGKKLQETDPNGLRANKTNQQDSERGNLQSENFNSTDDETGTDVNDTEEQEETTSEKKDF